MRRYVVIQPPQYEGLCIIIPMSPLHVATLTVQRELRDYI